ncbi:Hypothetical predicted protein, partial [Pelobates cultripes]
QLYLCKSPISPDHQDLTGRKGEAIAVGGIFGVSPNMRDTTWLLDPSNTHYDLEAKLDVIFGARSISASKEVSCRGYKPNFPSVSRCAPSEALQRLKNHWNIEGAGQYLATD